VTARALGLDCNKVKGMSSENAIHVRNAVSRFNQVRGVTDLEKDVAWQRILVAAAKYHVNVPELTWRELPVHQ